MKTVKLVCGKRVQYVAAGKILETLKEEIDAGKEVATQVFVGADIYDVQVVPQKNYVKVMIKLNMAFDDVFKAAVDV